MKIGISGATGQLGTMVVNKLKEKISADTIVALVRSPQKAKGINVEVREADYDKPEAQLKNSEIPFTLLRHAWYTENYTNAILGGRANGVILGSAGNGKISSATRTDFAEAAVAVLTGKGHVGKVYELAGDEAFTMSDMAAEISRQTGKTISYKNLPVDEYSAALVKAGLTEGAAQFYASVDVSTEKNDLFDSSHQLSELIGHPTTSLSKVITDILEKA